jgi:antitoxin component YwqK of YwqJK toxin-antitoxin module
MWLLADNLGVSFDPMIPGGNIIGRFESRQPFFSTMNTTFLSNHFAVPALACAALLTAGCSEKNAPQDQRITNDVPLALDDELQNRNSEKNAPQDRRMTNGVPLALDDELQNRNDGKWYWRDTTNLFTGIEVLHHTNGVIKLQLPFTNGVPHGHRMMWHPNGQNESEGDYVNGQRSGLWETWYPNGKPDKKGTFVNGKADGWQTFWHTNGVKSIEWFHKEGHPHGKMKSYHENGQLKQQGAYLEAKQNGNWTAWDEDGNKVREALFLKGSLITEKTFEASTDKNTPATQAPKSKP